MRCGGRQKIYSFVEGCRHKTNHGVIRAFISPSSVYSFRSLSLSFLLRSTLSVGDVALQFLPNILSGKTRFTHARLAIEGRKENSPKVKCFSLLINSWSINSLRKLLPTINFLTQLRVLWPFRVIKSRGGEEKIARRGKNRSNRRQCRVVHRFYVNLNAKGKFCSSNVGEAARALSSARKATSLSNCTSRVSSELTRTIASAYMGKLLRNKQQTVERFSSLLFPPRSTIKKSQFALQRSE